MPLFLNGHPVVSTNNGIIQHVSFDTTASNSTICLRHQCSPKIPNNYWINAICAKSLSPMKRNFILVLGCARRFPNFLIHIINVKLFRSCYQREWKRRHDFDAIDSTQINQPPQQQMSNNSLHNPNNRACKRCRKIVSLTLRKFKGYCRFVQLSQC